MWFWPPLNKNVINLQCLIFYAIHILKNWDEMCYFCFCRLVMYLFTFGFTLDPQGSKVMLKLSPHQELGALSQLQLLHTTLLHKGVMVNGNAKQELPAPQPCSLPPDAVRYETECLRTDFNLRIKQVLFQSLICAYYVGFIPMKFSEVRNITSKKVIILLIN